MNLPLHRQAKPDSFMNLPLHRQAKPDSFMNLPLHKQAKPDSFMNLPLHRQAKPDSSMNLPLSFLWKSNICNKLPILFTTLNRYIVLSHNKINSNNVSKISALKLVGCWFYFHDTGITFTKVCTTKTFNSIFFSKLKKFF